MIAAHFKNGKTKHFLSEIPQEYKSGKTLRLKKCQWSYGAPGHGKGVWDGLGGMVCTNFRWRTYRDGSAYINGFADAGKTAIEERSRARTREQGRDPHGFQANQHGEGVLGAPFEAFHVV